MGWYIALTCAGALSPMDGLKVVNTMGTLMQQHLIGGQLIYPFVDDNWLPIPGERDRILERMADINARAGHRLALSIDLGGMLVRPEMNRGSAPLKRKCHWCRSVFPCACPTTPPFTPRFRNPSLNLVAVSWIRACSDSPTCR
jgi:[acyl-carrier-protein] S-malonyltransferase